MSDILFKTEDYVFSYRVAGICIQNGKVLLQKPANDEGYAFPGGHCAIGETNEETLIRETREEAGLLINPSAIKEYGLVHRIDKLKEGGTFIQDNYYYLCDILQEKVQQKLDEYEARENFTLEFTEAEKAINTNRYKDHGPKSRDMIEREAKVLELLIKEGYL